MTAAQGLGRGGTVARVVTLPSRASFRTRGVQPSAAPPLALVYSPA